MRADRCFLSGLSLLRIAQAAAWALAACSAAAQVADMGCTVPRPPAGARVEMVLPQSNNNGMAMTVRAIDSDLGVPAVLAHYRELWKPLQTPHRPGSMENDIPGWRVISTVHDRCFITVQVRPGAGGSHALVTVTRPEAGPRVASGAPNFPVLPGSRIASNIASSDPVRNARTVVAFNAARVDTNREFYASGLGHEGWVLVTHRPVRTQAGAGHVLVLKRGVEEMNVVISPATDGSGGTTVVANVMDRP